MAGRSSPILPVRCPSARLQTSKFGKQRRDCFHSLPSVRPAQWKNSQPRLPDAEDGPTGLAATTPGQHRHALSSGSGGGKLQDLESRRPRPQRQTAAGERKLARLPVSWPLRSAAEATAKTFSSPCGALSGEPLGLGRDAAVGARRATDTVGRPKAHSTVVKTVNLEASLRLVPQATSTPIIIARMEERSRRSSHRSRGENVVASKPKRSGASPQPQNESERLDDVRWIDKGPVVSPTHAVVVRSPLKIWPNTSSSGDKEEATKDVSTQSAVSGSPLNSGGSAKTKAWDYQEQGRGADAERRIQPSKAWLNAVPLSLLLVVLCLLCLWGTHVLRASMGKNVAYSAMKAPKKAAGIGVGEFLTVPPEMDGSEAPVGAKYPKRTQDQDEDLERGEAAIKRALSERDDSYGRLKDAPLEQGGAVDNSADSGRGADSSGLTDGGTEAYGNTTARAKAE